MDFVRAGYFDPIPFRLRRTKKVYLSCEQKRTDRKRVIYCDYTYIMLTNTPQQETFTSPCRGKTEDLLLRTASIVPRVYTQYSPRARAPTHKWVANSSQQSQDDGPPVQDPRLRSGKEFTTGVLSRQRPPPPPHYRCY